MVNILGFKVPWLNLDSNDNLMVKNGLLPISATWKSYVINMSALSYGASNQQMSALSCGTSNQRMITFFNCSNDIG